MRVSPIFSQVGVIQPTPRVVRSVRPDDEYNRAKDEEPEPRPSRGRRRPPKFSAASTPASRSSNGVLSALIDLQTRD